MLRGPTYSKENNEHKVIEWRAYNLNARKFLITENMNQFVVVPCLNRHMKNMNDYRNFPILNVAITDNPITIYIHQRQTLKKCSYIVM